MSNIFDRRVCSSNELKCDYCNNSILIGSEMYILPCGHCFHINCIDSCVCKKCHKVFQTTEVFRNIEHPIIIDLVLVFTHFNQTIRWNIQDSLIKFFNYLTKFNRIHTDTLYIYFNNKIYKPTQSYEELNKPLAYFIHDDNTTIYISHMPND